MAGEACSSCYLTVNPVVAAKSPENTNNINETAEINGCAPCFEQLLGDLMANEGDVVELKCKIIGEPLPNIKWFLSNHEIFQTEHTQFSQIDGEVKLILNGVTQNDKGVYTVQATNSFGEAKCFSQLIVKSVNVADNLLVVEYPLVQVPIIDKIEPNEAKQDILDSTPIVTNGLPQMFQQKNHIEEYSTESSNVRIQKQSTITSKTTKLNAYQVDAQTAQGATMDKHSCVAIHSANETAEADARSSSVAQPNDKIVKPQKRSSAPRFITPFVGKIITQGANVILEAVYDGHPEPNIQLTKNDEPLQQAENVQITRQPNKIIITLANVTARDGGRYTCTARNANGNAASTADVVVKSMSTEIIL